MPESHSPLRRLIPLLSILWLLAYWFLFFTTKLPNASNAERTLYRSDLLFNLPELYAELIAGEGSPSSGIPSLSQRIVPVLQAFFIVAAAFAAGRLLLRGLRLAESLDRSTRWALAGGIGLSLLSLLTLGLGLCGLLQQWLFSLLFLLLIGVEAGCSWNSRRHVSPAVRSSDSAPIVRTLCVLLAVPFLCCMLLGALLPPTDFDVKEYHLGGPKEYFLAGQIQFLPHDVYTSFPFLTEMLLLAGMVVRGDWQMGALVGQAVLMVFAPITALGVVGVTRRLAGDAAGWLAGLIYLTIPWTYRISIIAYTEGALCGYVVLTLLAFLLWRERRRDAGSPWNTTGTLFLGMLAGSAVATKYPGMILVAIPFAVAGLLTVLQAPERTVRRVAVPCLLYAAGVLITFGPWMLKNLFETGNPVYPLLYSVFGGVDWNSELQAKWKAAHPSLLFQPGWNDLRGVLFANDWQSPLLFGFAPLAFLQSNRRAILEVALYALVLLAGWYLFTHRIDRFWVPMNSIMAVLAGCGLAALLGWPVVSQPQSPTPQKRPRAEPPGTYDILFLLRTSTVLGLVGGTLFYNFAFITTPLAGYNAYLLDYPVAWQQTETRSVTIVNSLSLPEPYKVLFVGEAELFNATFPYAYCTVFDQNLLELWTSDPSGGNEWTLKSREEILERFRENGITHVFVNWNEILRYRTTYRFTDFVTPRRFDELVERGVLEPVPLSQMESLRRWEGLDPSWQKEIERWGPELKLDLNGLQAMQQFQMFKVREL